jgi:hypothetical protein
MQIWTYRTAAATFLPKGKVEEVINDDFPSADLQEIKLLETLIT